MIRASWVVDEGVSGVSLSIVSSADDKNGEIAGNGVSKNKKEKYKSLALKARQVLSEDDASSSDSNDEEYAMVVRDFKKFFKRRGKFVRQPYDDKKNFRKTRRKRKTEDVSSVMIQITSLVIVPNTHSVIKRRLLSGVEAIVEMTPKRKRYISWPNQMRNKHLKAINESFKRDVCELKSKVEQLERNEEISHECESCDKLVIEISSLKLKLASFKNSSSSLRKMVEMQKPSKDKYGLGYTEDIASTSTNKIKNLGPQIDEMLSIESATPVSSATEPACSDEQNRLSIAKIENAEKAKILGSNIIKKNDSVRLKVNLELDEWIKDSGCTKHMTGNKDLFLSHKAIDGAT
ncbi:hypothetical protein Tco_1430878 [Tanacetum coccineum]